MTGAGDFRTRLTLQQRNDVADGQGGYVRSFSDVGKVWAKVVPLKGRESVVADAPGGARQVRIEVRAPLPVTLAHRLVDGTRIYRIVSYRYDTRIVTIDAEVRVD